MPKIEPFEKNTNKYEHWFEKNPAVFLSELNAVRNLMPQRGECVEIGVGTGRFAAPLGIEFGVEPSIRMGKLAKRRGIQVIQASGENLPLADAQFEIALMITTICFLDDIRMAFAEVYRILKEGGCFLIGFVDKNSPIGKSYEQNKEKSVFYSNATFYSITEIIQLLGESGFRDLATVQTIFHPLSETKKADPVKPGYGKGAFLIVRGNK